jgi:hypothetical protein
MNGPWQSHLLGVDARGRARSGLDKTSGQNSALENVIGRLKNSPEGFERPRPLVRI